MKLIIKFNNKLPVSEISNMFKQNSSAMCVPNTVFLLVVLSFVLVPNTMGYNYTGERELEIRSGVSSYTLPRWRGTAETFSGKEMPIPLPEVPEGMLPFLSNVSSAEYGASGVPFTTSGAYGAVKDVSLANLPTVYTVAPSDLRPWSATGKLEWDFGMFGMHIVTKLGACRLNVI